MSLFDFTINLIANTDHILEYYQRNTKQYIDITKKLDIIVQELKNTKERDRKMAIDLTALIEQVTRNAEVDASAYTLIVGLKTKVDELAADLAGQPEVAAKIAELAAALDASSDALADAVIANTPAEPDPIDPPVDEEPVEEPPVQ